jgi:hypothetical protein
MRDMIGENKIETTPYLNLVAAPRPPATAQSNLGKLGDNNTQAYPR